MAIRAMLPRQKRSRRIFPLQIANSTRVLQFAVDDEQLINRNAGHHACAECMSVYHETERMPVVSGICDTSGSLEFKCRADDNPDVFRGRLETYHRETAPLIDYYRCDGMLHVVDSRASIADVTSEVERLLLQHQ